MGTAGVRWDVQVAGHLCIDLEPDLPAAPDVTPGRLANVGPLAVRLGGCVGNTGADLAALGLRVLLVAAAGDDALARTATALVDAVPGADHEVEVAPGGATSYSIVLEPPGTDRTFWHHVGANSVFDGRQVDVAAAPLLHLGYLPLLPRLVADGGAPLVRLLRAARNAGVTTSVDLCVTPPDARATDWGAVLTTALPWCDVVSPSLDDLRSSLGDDRLDAAESADWLVRGGAAVAMVTAGSQGLVVRTAGPDRFAAGPPVLAALPATWHDRSVELAVARGPVVRTTGAGDAATAALLAAVHSRRGFDAGLDLVLAAAAHRVAGRGSLATLPATLPATRPATVRPRPGHAEPAERPQHGTDPDERQQ